MPMSVEIPDQRVNAVDDGGYFDTVWFQFLEVLADRINRQQQTILDLEQRVQALETP